MGDQLHRDHPDRDAVHARAFRWLMAKGGSLPQREIDHALEAGHGALKTDRARADLGGVPPRVWRCRCGAVLTNVKSRDRHVAGETMCQHQGDGLVEYQPAGVPA